MNYSTKTEVRYRDRQSGAIITENIFAENTLRWLYENWLGFKVFSYLLNNRAFCWLYGKSQNLPFTRQKIVDFVAQHQIDSTKIELPLQSYPSFNAFFSRKLKPNARPFAKDPTVFCAPGDGKVLVYPQLEARMKIPVKGFFIAIESLLASKTTARHYYGGSALVVRLAPYDYHRFHFPDSGTAEPSRYIKGEYHSVNPIALTKISDVYCRNYRAVTEFHSHNFGRIAYIEIGAITIGSIVQTYQPGTVQKGAEKGYFQYGGSTLVLLFEPEAISFDRDLIQDSAQNIEVSVLTGSQLGTKP